MGEREMEGERGRERKCNTKIGEMERKIGLGPKP